MPSGETISGSLSGALPQVVSDARIKKEFEGTWRRTCDIKKQQPNTGLSWTEFSLDKVSRQGITETTDNRNFQQLSGSLQSIEPTMNQIIIKVTDKTYRKIASVVKGKFGGLAGNAMNRGDDEDYLALFSTFATTNSPGTGNPMSFGYVSSAKVNITSNVTEPSMAEVFTVLHGRQIKDIQDEVLAGVGTYTIPVGMTEEVFRKGFAGTVAGSNVFEDGNITVDATPDANGATHSREGVIAAVGMEIKSETDRDLYYGGGADVISLTNEIAFAERKSGTTQVWAYRHFSDATAPTS
ncbi:hypothetical protein LCGC14_0726040 [marine sediment metagenome]|uniref:Capsid protein n=1 Tax=marine sediment metagenome TaxID=412755 RepID=A0A0F9QF74_9ZZZZ